MYLFPGKCSMNSQFRQYVQTQSVRNALIKTVQVSVEKTLHSRCRDKGNSKVIPKCHKKSLNQDQMENLVYRQYKSFLQMIKHRE